MQVWLERLQEQLSASLPKEPKSIIPPLDQLYLWVDELMLGAELCCEADKQHMGHLSWQSAWQNEASIIAALVVGRFVPPIRLEILRTLIHPSSLEEGVQGQCKDRDCRDRRCLGNHLKVVGGSAVNADAAGGSGDPTPQRSIRFKAPHHKNDRRGFASIEFDLPGGKLTQRLLDHIDNGHRLLTQTASSAVLQRGELPPTHLFVSRHGNPFSASTFCQFWSAIMGEQQEITYFPPGLARTSFVDCYTSEYGEEPEVWDGAATVMGNTVKTWKQHYNPRDRLRAAQHAVNTHSSFADGVGDRRSDA